MDWGMIYKLLFPQSARDIILVEGLAFARKGFRVGLSEARPPCCIVNKVPAVQESANI